MSFPYLVLYGALTLLTALPARALNFYVNSAPTVGDDRRSVQSAQNPATPFRTITHALRIAHLVALGRPHVIHIPAGYYSPDSTGETFPLVISQTRIYLSTSGVVTFDAEGKSNFFRITAPTSDFVIKGIVFRNGRAEQGGAIYCNTCSLWVVDNIFLDNRATGSGQVLYAERGRVKFIKNQVRGNGVAGDTGAVLSLHNTFADTTQREQIRNNTFYWNLAPAIQTSGNRTDISNNIFSNPDNFEAPGYFPPPAILDASPDAFPLVRYNMLWETPLFYISDQADSIKLAKTVRDTVTLAESGVQVPSFITNQPDTVAKAGSTYLFVPELEGNRAAYIFTPLALPMGVSATEVQEQKQIHWVPTLADTGRHELRIEIQGPVGNLSFLHYNIRVFSPETFPDTTDKGPIVTISLVPDTIGAVSALNALIPAFSTAASAGNNSFQDPKFINPSIDRFELGLGSPAIDAGNPIVALRDSPGNRSDLGLYGGPGNAGPPTVNTTFSELNITSLPDSIATEGQVYTYSPTLPNNPRINIIDLIPGLVVPPSMSRAFGRTAPIRWTPTAGDTGTYFIGVKVYTNNSQGRQYFRLHVKPGNELPLVRSTPPALAYEDSLLTYAIVATDPNGDSIAYAVTKGPTGLSVDATGKVTWTPTQAQVGSDTVEISLANARGTTTHRFAIEVRNTNDAPVIASHSPTKGTGPLVTPPLLGVSFSITASDEEGDALTYGWRVNGMTLADATKPGLILTSSATQLDTVEALVWDAADTTIFFWTVDGRSIPRLSLDTSAVDFGQVALGDTGRVARVMRNPGSDSLHISELQISDPAFTALFASSTIAPGDSVRLELRFVPTGLESKQDTFLFATNAPSQSAVQLRVSGSGTAVPWLIGDFDNNGAVDFADFFVFADHFGSQDPVYDLDHGGLVDLADFFVFADHFGERSAPQPESR